MKKQCVIRRGLMLLAAILTVWRLPDLLGTDALSRSPLALLAVAGIAVLYTFALRVTDQRLNRTAYAVGLLLSAMQLIGTRLNTAHTFAPITVGGVFFALVDLALFTLLFGAATALAYQALSRPRADKPEGRLARLTGNPWFVWLVLLLCWTPVFLAFWPGTFRYDAPTQFYTYIDDMLGTHHPLLHTLFLGRLLELSMDATEAATNGVFACNAIQMFLTAGCLAYGCWWLRKRGAPPLARLLVLLLFALLPMYPLWSFCVTKDVLFGALVLLTTLQLIDFWTDDTRLRSPWRIALFVLVCALMMHLRNNGVYAFALLLPFAVLLAGQKRVRRLLLCLACIAVYIGSLCGLVALTDAESGNRVEMFSVPLQQLARVTRDAPDTLTDDERAYLAELYPDIDLAALYDAQFADNVKWSVTTDMIEETGTFLGKWLQIGLKNPLPYLEAFLEQNLPYYHIGSPMRYNIVLGVEQMEEYPIEERSLLPDLRAPYQEYDRTLTFLGLPAVYPLSNTALMVWLCVLLAGFAIYRRDRATLTGCLFLLAVWVTNLLGPVAIIRYMLGFFYAVPILTASLFSRKG